MEKDLKKLKIAVLCGGRSGEREVSLRSGKRVFESLKNQGFNVIQSDIDDDLVSRLKKNKIDVAYLVLHGKYGEDGTIQGLLEITQIPYTGSGVLASALAINKVASKRIFQAIGIPTPKFIEVDPQADLKNEAGKISGIFAYPLVVKPLSEGSSLGVTIVKKEDDLEKILKETIKKHGNAFVEEFIKGKEVTVGILGNEALPILELVPKSEFYDFKAKYTEGGTEFILPARLSPQLAKKVQEIALTAHRALGCRAVSRVDMIIGADNVPYVHDVNTIPGMTENSDLPAEAKHIGLTFDELVVKILEISLNAE
ncbi:D-alanine--D-alanine ligase [Candidatus Saganbacteria bacterium]|nr:D-alanine--D-alanine ligase [Candidatus Saganbacteria bacterium]